MHGSATSSQESRNCTPTLRRSRSASLSRQRKDALSRGRVSALSNDTGRAPSPRRGVGRPQAEETGPRRGDLASQISRYGHHLPWPFHRRSRCPVALFRQAHHGQRNSVPLSLRRLSVEPPRPQQDADDSAGCVCTGDLVSSATSDVCAISGSARRTDNTVGPINEATPRWCSEDASLGEQIRRLSVSHG